MNRVAWIVFRTGPGLPSICRAGTTKSRNIPRTIARFVTSGPIKCNVAARSRTISKWDSFPLTKIWRSTAGQSPEFCLRQFTGTRFIGRAPARVRSKTGSQVTMRGWTWVTTVEFPDSTKSICSATSAISPSTEDIKTHSSTRGITIKSRRAAPCNTRRLL